MKPSTDTTSGEIATGNPRDAFTAEHQRAAWQLVADFTDMAAMLEAKVTAATTPLDILTILTHTKTVLECARLAQQIATGAL